MNNSELLVRRNRFVALMVFGFFILVSRTMDVFLMGLPIAFVLLAISFIKKRPNVIMYLIITLSYSLLLIKEIFGKEPIVIVLIFAFFALSIPFQKITAIVLSAIYSTLVCWYGTSHLDEKLIKALEYDTWTFPYLTMGFILVMFLYGNQTYVQQKLQQKNETETINAKKGRKKVRLLLEKIKGSTKSVSEFSETINKNMENVKKYSEDFTQGFKEMNGVLILQNENIKIIDKNMNQINENVNGVTDSFQYMFEGLETTSQTTIEGHLKLKKLEKEVSEVDDVVTSLGNTMRILQVQSKDVMEISDFISSIANQTNILALNAGIEASRAGEHGRGFTVVASEVKKLADQSSQSAKGISTIVEKIIEQTQNAYHQTEKSEKTVNNSKTALYELTTSFDTILTQTKETVYHSNRVREMMKNLSESSNEISEQIIHLTNSNEQSTAEINQLFQVVEKQNEKIHEISDEFFKLENELKQLSNEK